MGRRLALGALVHAALIAVVAAAYFGLGHGLLAALVAGALFHPVRRGLQLLVGLDRDPYRLVDAVSRSVETAGGSAEALSSGATAIGEALRARGVLIEIDGRPTVTHGTLDGEVAETPLVWQGRTVGRLVVAGGDRSRGLHEMLARHLAEVVHAVQLTEALERAKERLVEAREEERGRLLRVLDGELGSALAELSEEVRQARTWVRERQEAADAVLKRVRERLAEAIADVRDFVYGLRPPEPAPEQPPVVTAARTPAPEPVVEPLSWRARAVVWVAWTGGVVSPLLVLAATWLAWQAKWAAGWQPIDPIGTMFPAAAAFLIRYRRRLFIPWLMWSIGLAWAMYEVAYGLSYWLHQEIPGHPLLPYVTWVSAWAWVWPVMGFGAVMPLLFPDGHLPARRWRWVMYGVVAMTVIHTLDMALMPDMWRETRLPVENPFGVAALGGWPWFAESHIGWVMLPLSALAVTALGVRYWRAGPDTRRQIVWYVATMISYTVLWIARQAIADGDGSSTGSVMIAINLVVSAGVPISIVASVLRHRIYGISVILYRTLVYGTLAALLTLVYVGMLWSGNLLAGGLGPTAGLAAALAVGAVFHPVRLRLQRSVDQLLGVERDPYRAADELSRSVQRADEPAEALNTATALLRWAVGARGAAVEVDGELHVDGHLGRNPRSVALTWHGEPVGRLLLSGEPPLRRLFAGLPLEVMTRHLSELAHAVLLAADLRRSRERIAAAREEERRRLGRELHDGLGPALTSITMTLDAARRILPGDPDRARALLGMVHEGMGTTLVSVRELVDGLRPPALDSLGLAGSLTAFAQAPGPRVEVHLADRLGELPADVELAAYRIVQEALTNVRRHAAARSARIDLRRSRDALHITVSDDGSGLPQTLRHGIGLTSMRERATEVGGRCTIAPGPQGGTRVTARLPVA